MNNRAGIDGTMAVVNAKPRILFVDDEPNILNSLRWLFKRDYDVTLAQSGQEALDLLRRRCFHVIVCDQRMPGVTGIQVLKQAAQCMPGAMRILLTGYSDLKAVVGSVNEGEVFRFVTKPWANDELKAVVALAAETAVDSRAAARPTEPEAARPGAPAVLVIDRDPAVHDLVAQALGEGYALYPARNLDQAMDYLDANYIQVVVADTRVDGADVTALLKLLKHHHPDIVSVVMTDQSDSETIISLINQGQVYRFLQKPVKPGQCRLSIQSALVKHAQLRASPDLARRHAVDALAGTAPGNEDSEAGALGRLAGRVRHLRRWLGGA